ncbi:MAG: HPr family phosphocarrier protein [Stagnimonas sp.]|nr:HPr family phosphocarrier protein [Stagnimonas sp.]
MSCGLLLVTHGKLGHFLLDTLRDMLGELSLKADVLEVRLVQSHEGPMLQGTRMLENLDSGDGVLLLTDAYGSTPSNVAHKLIMARAKTAAVAGLNLPMLMRVFNSATLSLDALAQAAVEGGQQGVVRCPQQGSTNLTPTIATTMSAAAGKTVERTVDILRAERTVDITNKLGLHARASAKLVTLANKFTADVRLKKDDREVSAKSILNIIMLAAGLGSEVTLIAEGEDAEQAIEELAALVADKFGEEA